MTRSAADIFHEARDMPAEKREGYLVGACGEDLALRSKVEALLKADAEAGGFMSSPTAGEASRAQAAAATSQEQAGAQIGRYKLLEQIGEGGMGTIWMAEQREPVKRRVALKIIKLGMDTKQVIARFEAERQALAMMDHPNIAKVFDAGATETGRPYFVMEYIKGIPILEYCDQAKVDTKARLELFTAVCHAIQHAHQKGIIHRDIKPSNVLVTLHDGVAVPKVIDFGIAKATNSELTTKTLFTEHRQIIGTPAYMSPEQAEMSGLDIDTRSDIYSLGVLLYELLTGTTPFDIKALLESGFGEMMRAIREDEPHKPSTRISLLGDTGTRTALQRNVDAKKLSTLLRGDIDWIVMKCLEKDRSRRYDTANGLAADIRRHLNDEPVTAGAPSAGYRLRKFVKRNKVQVLAGGAVAAALILVSVVTAVTAYRLSQQKQELAREKAISDQRLRTYSTTVSQLVNEAPKLLESAPMGSGTRSELLTLLESALMESEDAGAVGTARQNGLAAIALREGDRLVREAAADLEQSDRRGVSTDRLAQAAEQYARAERLFREAYDSRPEDASKAAANLAKGLSAVAVVQSLQHKPLADIVATHKRAIDFSREALAAAQPDNTEVVAMRRAELGMVLIRYADALFSNRAADVQRFATRSLELTTESCGLLQEAIAALPASSRPSAETRGDLGRALQLRAFSAEAVGQTDEAVRAFAEAVTVYQQLCAEYPNRYSYRKALVESANRHGDFLLGRKADVEAIGEPYSLAMQALRRMLDEPELGDLLNGGHGLAMQFYRLGLLTLLRGDRGEAREQFARCALLREMAWHDSLDELQGDEQSDGLITQRIELMLAQARSGQAESAISHAQWLSDRARQLGGNDPATPTQAGGFGADRLFLFSAAGFGLASEQVSPERRPAVIGSAISATAQAIRSGYADADYLLQDPDLAPLASVQEFRDLVAGIRSSGAK